MEKFDCAKVGDTEWAAARVNPGDTVFFLQWNGTNGTPRTPTASAAPHRRACPSRSSPTASRPRHSSPAAATPTTPVTQACTAEAILAALPAGATMEKFTCADVSGKLWAAARVDPGNTVFFLQWNGTAWNAEDSDSVCGTASAGLPQKLLDYCQ